MSWDSFSAEIEYVEEIADTNPETYYARAEEALRIGDYKGARYEVSVGIQYGLDVSRGNLLVLRSYFENHEYSAALKYIKSTNMWKYRYNYEGYDRQRLFHIVAVCIRECHLDYNNIGAIMVTNDGKGMCGTIQEAIDLYGGKKEILLVGGEYKEDIEIYNNTTKIRGLLCYSNNPSRITAVIRGCITVSGDNIEIRDISVQDTRMPNEKRASLYITGSGINLENIVSASNEEVGLFISSSRGIKVNACSINGNNSGLVIYNSTHISVHNSQVYAMKDGICIEENSSIIAIDKSEIGALEIGLSVERGSIADISNSIVKGSPEIGCFIEGEAIISKTKIIECREAGILNKGCTRVENCELSRNYIGIMGTENTYIMYSKILDSKQIGVSSMKGVFCKPLLAKVAK